MPSLLDNLLPDRQLATLFQTDNPISTTFYARLGAAAFQPLSLLSAKHGIEGTRTASVLLALYALQGVGRPSDLKLICGFKTQQYISKHLGVLKKNGLVTNETPKRMWQITKKGEAVCVDFVTECRKTLRALDTQLAKRLAGR
jgi:DNA-binding HxlR family transcriptional regulator